jgi:outer membrane receptor for ferrienterochelin and colicin
MRKLHFKIQLFIVLSLFCLTAVAEDKESLEAIAARDKQLLTEIEDLKEAYKYVKSASKIPLKEREAPGIVTVISEEEILNSGARDLVDVLRLVPGFDFGTDVENTIGVGVRGNWAHEGKVVLLIDGLEMNERRFANVFLGQHYPIDHIQKIEVIRGPGSVMYGGFAKLGVINVITKSANDLQGMSVVGRYGQMAKSNGHRNINFYAGKKLTDDMSFNVSGKVGEAHRSDRLYQDAFGTEINLANTNTSSDYLLNAGFQYKDLALRFFVDDYKVESSDRFVAIDNAMTQDFKTYVFDLKYQHELADNLKLHVNFDYSNQLPWVTKAYLDGKTRYTNALLTQRYLGGARLDYAFKDTLKLTGGLEYSHEDFKNLAGQYDNLHTKDSYMQKLPTYENVAPYLEGLVKTEWTNFTFGLRYDYHNTFAPNFSQRFVLTDSFSDFHYKLLYNKSFRIPTIENAILSTTQLIKPERNKSYEMELGYDFNKNLTFNVNAFYSISKDIIVYGVSPANRNAALGQGQEYYNANQKIESVGVESELRWKQEWGYLTLNHSYSQFVNNFKDFQPINQSTNQIVNSNLALAFPAHKVTLNTHIELTPSLSINPSFIISSSRYGYNQYDNTGTLLILHKYPPEVLANLYLRYQNLFFKNLELGIGAYNLFNANHNFIQPYNSGHAPLPDKSREIIFRLSYQYN